MSAADDGRPGTGRLSWLRDRGMAASMLVAAIATAFGVVLIAATGFTKAVFESIPGIGHDETLASVVAVVALVLLGVAVYVAAIVTANTFSTVIAGRTRQIALVRLIGATARSQRRRIGGQGLLVGAIGACLGLIAGTVLAAIGVAVAVQVWSLHSVQYNLIQASLAAPAVIVVLTTWASARVGSRRVLTVTPLQALAGSIEASHRDITRRHARHTVAIVLIVVGAMFLGLGVVTGLQAPTGGLVAFVGGVLSFTGLALGATLVMPPVLRLVGRIFGRSATARLAAENALRYPERSSRMAIGVVIGVTLVTMFAVTTETAKQAFSTYSGGKLPAQVTTALDTFSGIMTGLVTVSAVIAAIGLVNLLTLGIVQRRREFGLLRALGLSNSQIRRVVLLEAAHLTIAAVATGLLLGVFYAGVAAQSLLGRITTETGRLVWPAVPLWPVVAIIIGTAVVTLAATVTPTRLATRVSPIAALTE